MSNLTLYNQISDLPNDLKKEVEDFVAFLKARATKPKKVKQRKFGYAKGFFKISSDFDESLEDFKEYMYS